MSIENHAAGSLHRPEQVKPEEPPRPYPWCLACGFQHVQGAHCAGCNGDHSAGYCMTDELATELARVGELRELVTRASDHLFNQIVRQIVHSRGGE